MENQELDSLTLSNGAELTRGTEIAVIEDFSTGSPGTRFTAGEIYEVSSFELVPDEQTVVVFLDDAPLDIVDLELLEDHLESRQLAIVEPRASGTGTW
jgi:hypothetical protein